MTAWAAQSLSGRNRTSDPVIADIYSHMLYQLSYAEAGHKSSAVVQWLGYLAFTQETRVQTPAAEVWPLSNLNSNPQKRRRQGSNLRMQSTLA